MKSFTVVSKIFPHIKADDVLAVPEPPTSNTPFCWKAVLEWTGFGWSKIALTKKSVLHESTVGSNNCENLKPFYGDGCHFYGVINFHYAFPS